MKASAIVQMMENRIEALEKENAILRQQSLIGRSFQVGDIVMNLKNRRLNFAKYTWLMEVEEIVDGVVKYTDGGWDRLDSIVKNEDYILVARPYKPGAEDLIPDPLGMQCPTSAKN